MNLNRNALTAGLLLALDSTSVPTTAAPREKINPRVTALVTKDFEENPGRYALLAKQRAARVSGKRKDAAVLNTFVREMPKVGANEPCPCGSGLKFKRCHKDSLS